MDQMHYEEVALTQKHQGKLPERVETKVQMVGMSDGGGGSTSDDYDKKNKEIFQAAMSSAGLSSTATLSGCTFDGQDHPQSSTEFKMASALLSRCTTTKPFKAVWFAGSADENVVFADVLKTDDSEVSCTIGGCRYTFTVTGTSVKTERVFVGESIPETEEWNKRFEDLVGSGVLLESIVYPGASYANGTTGYTVLNTIYNELKNGAPFYVTWAKYTYGAKTELIVLPVEFDATVSDNTVFGVSIGNLSYAIVADAYNNPSKFDIRFASDLRDSEEFDRLFTELNNGQYYLNQITYTVSGEPYAPSTAAFKAVKSIYDKIKNSKDALMVPWSKIDVNGLDSEISIATVAIDPTDDNGLTLGFTIGNKAYKFVLDAPTPTVITAYLVVADEDMRDSIEFNKTFQAIVEAPEANPFTMGSLSFTTDGVEYQNGTTEFGYIKKLMAKLSTVGPLQVTQTISTNDSKDEVIVTPAVALDTKTIVYSFAGKHYRIEFDNAYPSATSIMCYELEYKRDSEVFTENFESVTGGVGFKLSSLAYSVAGVEYPGSSNEFAYVKNYYDLCNPSVSPVPYSTTNVYDDVEILCVPLKIEDHIMSFTVDDKSYAIVFDDSFSKMTCFELELDDKRDSIEFNKEFQNALGNPEGTETFINEINASVDGKKYTDTEPEYITLRAIFDLIKTDTIAMPVTWSRLNATDVGDPVYSIVSMVMDPLDLNKMTMGLTIGNRVYKYIFDDTASPATVTAYVSDVAEDKRDSEVFNAVFQELINRPLSDQLKLKDLNFTVEGTTYGTSDAVFADLVTIMTKLKSIGAMYGTWDQVTVDTDKNEIIVAPLRYVSDKEFELSLYGYLYKVQFDSDTAPTTASCIIVKSEDLRDSFEFDKIYQEAIGRTAGNPFLLREVTWTEDGFTYSSTDPEYALLKATYDKVKFGELSYCTWDKVTTPDDEIECVMVPVSDYLDAVDGIIFIADGYARIIESGVDYVKCQSKSIIDTRDSILYDNKFHRLINDASNSILLKDIIMDGATYNPSNTEFNILRAILYVAMNESAFYVTWDKVLIDEVLEPIVLPVFFDGPGFIITVSDTTYHVVFDDTTSPSLVSCYVNTVDDLRDSTAYNENYQMAIGAMADNFALSYVDYPVGVYKGTEPGDDYYDYLSATIEYVKNEPTQMVPVTWSLINKDLEIHIVNAYYDDTTDQVSFTLGPWVYIIANAPGSLIMSGKRLIDSRDNEEFHKQFKFAANVDDDTFMSSFDYSYDGVIYSLGTPQFTHLTKLINSIGLVRESGQMVTWAGKASSDMPYINVLAKYTDEPNGDASITFTVVDTTYKVVYDKPTNTKVTCYILKNDSEDTRDSEEFHKEWQTMLGTSTDFYLSSLTYTPVGNVYGTSSPEFSLIQNVYTWASQGEEVIASWRKQDIDFDANSFTQQHNVTLSHNTDTNTISFYVGGDKYEIVKATMPETYTCYVNRAQTPDEHDNEKALRLYHDITLNEIMFADILPTGTDTSRTFAGTTVEYISIVNLLDYMITNSKSYFTVPLKINYIGSDNDIILTTVHKLDDNTLAFSAAESIYTITATYGTNNHITVKKMVAEEGTHHDTEYLQMFRDITGMDDLRFDWLSPIDPIDIRSYNYGSEAFTALAKLFDYMTTNSLKNILVPLSWMNIPNEEIILIPLVSDTNSDFHYMYGGKVINMKYTPDVSVIVSTPAAPEPEEGGDDYDEQYLKLITSVTGESPIWTYNDKTRFGFVMDSIESKDYIYSNSPHFSYMTKLMEYVNSPEGNYLNVPLMYNLSTSHDTKSIVFTQLHKTGEYTASCVIGGKSYTLKYLKPYSIVISSDSFVDLEDQRMKVYKTILRYSPYYEDDLENRITFSVFREEDRSKYDYPSMPWRVMTGVDMYMSNGGGKEAILVPYTKYFTGDSESKALHSYITVTKQSEYATYSFVDPLDQKTYILKLIDDPMTMEKSVRITRVSGSGESYDFKHYYEKYITGDSQHDLRRLLAEHTSLWHAPDDTERWLFDLVSDARSKYYPVNVVLKIPYYKTYRDDDDDPYYCVVEGVMTAGVDEQGTTSNRYVCNVGLPDGSRVVIETDYNEYGPVMRYVFNTNTDDPDMAIWDVLTKRKEIEGAEYFTLKNIVPGVDCMPRLFDRESPEGQCLTNLWMELSNWESYGDVGGINGIIAENVTVLGVNKQTTVKSPIVFRQFEDQNQSFYTGLYFSYCGIPMIVMDWYSQYKVLQASPNWKEF